jgi:uncharacterized protein YqgC (DUF456 family)
MSILLWIAGGVLVAVGVVGVILPALPGPVLIVVGLVLAAWADNFSRVGVGTLVLIGAIGAASYGVDFVAAALGTRRLGASARAMTGAALGTIAGLFLGLPGLIVGPFVGAFLGELSAHRDIARAGKAGVAAWIGFAIGAAVKVGIAFLMLAIFLAALIVF